ncbi:hypothetical protein KDA23_03430 [Candidatus Saccharibacteria bacterium]|nr:hypothetical protein [Candidatus Saccharibacteria bacterium]
MEGYNPNRRETTPDNESESSKETNTKKKKRLGESITQHEAVTDQQADKKESVAEKSKAMWERLLKADERSTVSESPETDAHEHIEEAEEAGEALETLSSEEEIEAELFLTEGRLEELYAGQGHDTDPEDAAVRQASIDFLENRRYDILDKMPPVELEDDAFAEQPQDVDEDVPVSVGGAATPPGGGHSGGASTGSGGSLPPRLPHSPPRRGTPPHGPSGPGFRTAPNFNFAPKQEAYQPDYRTNPNATYLLVGGLVGYFIGRRRGRIKTEKRMKIVQDKLEKQIEAKQREIVTKEMEIQRKTRENYQLHFEKTQQETKTDKPLAPQPEVVPRMPELKRQSISEMPVSSGLERGPKTVELADKDLIAMSEKVKVGETNLKQIYEAKLVTEAGLKRLVSEHLAGNDIRRALAREFLAKELSYERDPRLRDAVSVEKESTPKAAGLAPTDLVEQQQMQAQATPMPTSVRPDTPTQPAPPSTTAVSTGLLIALTILAIGLAVYAVVLGLSR